MRIKLLLFIISLFLVSANIYSQVPDSPILSEPPDISLVNNTNVQLKWNSVLGATYYGIKVATNSDFTDAIDLPEIYTNYVDIGTLASNTMYFWVVYASNGFGSSLPSDVFSFKTSGGPIPDLEYIDNTVQNLVSTEQLNSTLGSILRNRLDQARDKIEQSKWSQATSKITQFNSLVQMYRYSNFISESNANLLIADGNSLIELLNSFNSPILEEKPITDNYILKQNFPNPFNPYTFIQYSIPTANNVTLKVYDMTGREVTELVNKFQNAGEYMVQFNGNNLGSGVYIYKLISGNIIETRKMVLVK